MAKVSKGKKLGVKIWPPPAREGPPATPRGICRLRVYFSGQVQGVGMRATAGQLAPRFSVQGWVRNLPDGRVEILAEGKQADIENFLAAIGDEMSTYIRQVSRNWEEPTENLQGFTIDS